MGATAIPSMMIRTILGGTDVEQAARLQIIITFMMAASTTLSCIIATHFVLWICVDSEQHIRSNCIDTRPHVVRRAFNSVKALDGAVVSKPIAKKTTRRSGFFWAIFKASSGE